MNTRWVAAALAAALVMGCERAEAPLATSARALIDDDAHGGGASGFLFLPPLVPAPRTRGEADAGAAPEVRIEQIDGRSARVIAVFTTAGRGDEAVRFDRGSGAWHANWHTGRYALDPAKRYRISVYARFRRLGFADLDVVKNGRELRNVDTGEYVPLQNGRTLPIKFHVAADGDRDGVADYADVCPRVADPAQGDADGDGTGDACEARFVHHALAPRVLVRADGREARLDAEIAAQPGASVQVTVDWGDGATARVAVADGARHGWTHDYAADGEYPVSATLCAPPGGCERVALGSVRVVADKHVVVPTPAGAGGDERLIVGLALEAVRERGAHKGIGDVLDLRPGAVIREAGGAHVRFEQRHRGVPVFGGAAVVHLAADGTIADLTDALVPDVDVGVEPTLLAEDAVAASLGEIGCVACVARPPAVELHVFRGDERDHLTWRVETLVEGIDAGGRPLASMPVRFIDATTGDVVFAYDNLQTGSGPSLYSGEVTVATTPSAGTYYLEDPVRRVATYDGSTYSDVPITDDDDLWTDPDQQAALDAQFAMMAFVDYLQTAHGRAGIDGNLGPGSKPSVDGSQQMLVARLRVPGTANNAYWDGVGLKLGDGDGTAFSPLVSVDVVGHEMAHGLIRHTANLVYYSESGALNESWADVFGVAVERFAHGETDGLWKIGEQCFTPLNGTGDALRYFVNPHLASNAGYTADDNPDHYAERYQGAGDNRGVHINSSIGNKAFHLLAAGGAHHVGGGGMRGIGFDKAMSVWYRALTVKMTPWTDFLGARQATLSAAADLFGSGSADHHAVAQAWDLVGVGKSIVLINPTPDFDESTIRNGGFEAPIHPWVLGGSAWHSTTGNYAQAGKGYVYLGSDNSATGTAYQSLRIPADATRAYLYFHLNVSSAETTTTTAYDKLFLEVRDDRGVLLATLVTWSNLDRSPAGSYMQKGPFNLLPYKGKSIRLQFRATTDASLFTTFRVDSVILEPGGTLGLGLQCPVGPDGQCAPCDGGGCEEAAACDRAPGAPFERTMDDLAAADLDADTLAPGGELDADADFHFERAGALEPHAVLVHSAANGAALARVEGDFDAFTACDAAPLDLAVGRIDAPFAPGFVYVLRTSEGALFKIAAVATGADTVTWKAARLSD